MNNTPKALKVVLEERGSFHNGMKRNYGSNRHHDNF